ncbi:MAG: RIP metalloprotease RseP [Candidatus Pacebacteria bacterium]|nr:RIP metalloprotease RseP [Candidatus Paceibacterota bacterium]
MSILIFIIVLAFLILVHELGHFIFAKKSGMLVEEFSIGFPPHIFSFKKGETKYSIGAIPFGGYVKIFGEDYLESNSSEEKNSHRRFTNQSKKAQALVLAAGVFFNFLLAWVLFSMAFVSGMPVSASQFENESIQDPALVLINVLKDSPAYNAGLKVGDNILYLNDGIESLQDFTNIEDVTGFIATRGEKEIEVLYKRGGETNLTNLIPQDDLIEGKSAIGVSLDIMGIVDFPIHLAIIEGAKTTASLSVATIIGLSSFVGGIFTGNSDLSQISGPIGIISMVGTAFDFGFLYLISFIALISINLAVINLIPIPALDGGRLLFVLIEAIKGTPIKSKLANVFNLAGFLFLILLMLIITISDISKFF